MAGSLGSGIRPGWPGIRALEGGGQHLEEAITFDPDEGGNASKR